MEEVAEQVAAALKGQQAAFHLGLRKARAWRNCLINWQGAVAQLASVHVALARPRE